VAAKDWSVLALEINHVVVVAASSNDAVAASSNEMEVVLGSMLLTMVVPVEVVRVVFVKVERRFKDTNGHVTGDGQ